MAEDVIVLMSTYNGSKFIKEQLDSISNQSYEGRILTIIRDDGSKDDTTKIIDEYPKTALRDIRLVATPNVGPQKSFLELIKMADVADYYFFADQDDVWLPSKIEAGVNAMKGIDEPVAFCSNYTLTNGTLDVLDEKAIKATPDFTPIKAVLYNQIPGCCMGLNFKLMDLLKKIKVENCMMHDSMALALAIYTGKAIYDETPGILHRIHGNNVIGEGRKKIVPHKWIKEKFSLLIHKENYDISEMADSFIIASEGKNHPEYTKDMELLRDFKKSFGKTLKLLRHPDAKKSSVSSKRTILSIKCKIFFHLF